jgi:hypothetical protein
MQARSLDPVTSKGKRKVNKYEQAVLEQLAVPRYSAAEPNGVTGLTGKELAIVSGHPLNCITPRFAPLRRKGLIKAATTLNIIGPRQVIKRDKQIVWVLA